MPDKKQPDYCKIDHVPRRMKVLICEDEEILLAALEFRLKKRGFKVDLTTNAERALEIIQQEPPALLVVDLSLPGMSGMDLVKSIRNDLKHDFPVIIITAYEEYDIVLDALEKGADDFILKPFKPTELILRIKRLIDLHS